MRRPAKPVKTELVVGLILLHRPLFGLANPLDP